MSQEEKEDSLKETVRILAGQPSRRSKRALTVKVLRPTVLAPFAFAPNIEVVCFFTIIQAFVGYQFNILGPTVLSPNLFSPSILTPLLLSPPVLSPQVFFFVSSLASKIFQIGHPLILSPYLLGPNVLSGSIFNPYILSPYVLSPNVLNPYVMSPLILSPLVLCPALSSPTLMSGSILSPSVASPAVLTESALVIAVLSPSVLQWNAIILLVFPLLPLVSIKDEADISTNYHDHHHKIYDGLSRTFFLAVSLLNFKDHPYISEPGLWNVSSYPHPCHEVRKAEEEDPSSRENNRGKTRNKGCLLPQTSLKRESQRSIILQSHLFHRWCLSSRCWTWFIPDIRHYHLLGGHFLTRSPKRQIWKTVISMRSHPG